MRLRLLYADLRRPSLWLLLILWLLLLLWLPLLLWLLLFSGSRERPILWAAGGGGRSGCLCVCLCV